MHKNLNSVFMTVLVAFGASVTEARAVPLPVDSSAACFTIQGTGTCGMASTGGTITCEDGSSGPGWLRIAPKTYKCVYTRSGESGRRECSNVAAEVQETMKRFGCPRDTYGEVETMVLQTCPTAKLAGGSCS